MSTSDKTRIVGAPVLRKEGVDKLLGRARYVDDIERKGMWFGLTVRSTIPRGFIRSIKFDRRIEWDQFTIVTAADIPGKNHRPSHHRGPAGCLADGIVNHCDGADSSSRTS
jgi:CO/xanthine dehydrogenase Mo-binding subunit